MKLKASIIIGTVLVIGILFGALRASFWTAVDLHAQAAEARQEAQIATEKARKASCFLMGNLTATCYSDSKDAEEACGYLNKEEYSYMEDYHVEAYVDCANHNRLPPDGTVLSSGEITETETGIPDPSIQEDSLFLDGE